VDDAREATPRRTLWVVVALVGLVALTAGVLMSGRPAQFSSTAVVSLEPKPGDRAPDASTISLLAAPYAAYASADSTLQKVSETAGMSLDDVRAGVAVTMPASSTNIEIVVTLPTAAQAVEVAGRVASEVVTFAATDPVLRATITNPPGTPKETLLSQAQPVLMPAALGGGAALVILAVFMLLAPLARRRRERRAVRRPPPREDAREHEDRSPAAERLPETQRADTR
jgi:hypothetical protein